MKITINRIRGKRAKLGGVAQGVSDYFDIDVSLIRIIMVALILSPVPIIILYVLSWIFLPAKDERLFLDTNQDNNGDQPKTI